jgi:endonuclease III
VSDISKALNAALKKAGPLESDPFFEEERGGIEQLVYAFLLWESTRQRANAAYKRLTDGFVDFNDLRVARPRDIAEALGKTYPLADERSVRLLTTLNEIYLREYEVSLDKVIEGSKREAKKYLESLEGMSQFVCARVLLYGAGAHAIPVDERLLGVLISLGVFEEGLGVDEAAGSLERSVKASDGIATADRLQQLSDLGAKVKKGSSKNGAKSGSKSKTKTKKSTKKKTTKAASGS